MFRDVRAKLIHDGYRPAVLQHDHRDLCMDQDWSRVCIRFPETLDCNGEPIDGDCDFIFETPKSETHGRYYLVSTSVTPKGRVVDHEQLADSEDLEKIDARRDLQRKGCGAEPVLRIRVCDLPWPLIATSDGSAAGARQFRSTLWWADPDHGKNYAAVRTNLMKDGFRPARFEHDFRDQCTEDLWSHLCKRMPEALDCWSSSVYDNCAFVFEWPRGAWTVHGPYLVVQAVLIRDRPVVFRQKVPNTDELRKIWARRKLKQRGCQEDYLFELRDCNSAGPALEKAPPPAKMPAMPVLPPLPPSAK
jgi:hypothetical protein